MKKKVRWLLRNSYTFIGKKTIKGRDYLYARKGNRYRSAGPYDTTDPYLRSLTSQTEPKPTGSKAAAEMLAKYRREYEQLEADAIANPARLSDYVRQLVPLRDPDIWQRFSLLAGEDGPAMLDEVSVARSYEEKMRTVAANGAVPVDYYTHVVAEMKKWMEWAIESKRGSLAPFGTVSSNCGRRVTPLEACVDSETDSWTYAVWCNSCSGHLKWNCRICKETMRCVIDNIRGVWLRCPRCGYGYTFATPIKLNSPRTNEGWRLLDRIVSFWPIALDANPIKVLEVVNLYEKNTFWFYRSPLELVRNLRKAGVSPKRADFIASLQLDMPIRTA